MPGRETSPMDQRTQFIADYLRRSLSMTELCTHYGISRKTGYKWVDRYLHDGPQGLEDLSRKPYTAPNRAPEHVVKALVDVRTHHPTWGAKKLLATVGRRHRGWELPARSTTCEILKRLGMVARKRSRRRIGHPGKPVSEILAPNDCWCEDFNGQFKTVDGIYCHPLTVTDGYSRFLLGCQALDSKGGRGQAHLHPPIQGARPAHAHPHRQRCAFCHKHAGPAFAALGLVGTSRCDAGAHRAGQAAAERTPRANAPHAQGRDHPTPG